jgi:hypothetical protein
MLKNPDLLVLVIALAFLVIVTFPLPGHNMPLPLMSTTPQVVIPQSPVLPPVGPPSVSSSSGSSAGQRPMDISNWRTLQNRYGWSVKYPALWDASGLSGAPANLDAEASLQGPGGCYETNQECGNISIGIWIGSISPTAATRRFDNSSPKDFLLATEFPTPPDPEKTLLEQGGATIAGDPAYYVVFRQKNFESYPNGIIMKKIVVKDRNRFYTITSYETGKNNQYLSSINSPGAWLLTPTFDKIISTLTFKP